MGNRDRQPVRRGRHRAADQVLACRSLGPTDLAAWRDSLSPGQFRHLFDFLPGTLFFAKDRQRRLVMGNQAFVRRCGFEREDQLVGLDDTAIFAPRLAAKYARDDERVLRTGEPMLALIELFPDARGAPEWYVTDKLPLRSRTGEIVGLCGIVRSIGEQRAAMQPYLELAESAEHLRENFRAPLQVGALAARAGLSVRQFERKFRSTFQTTPRNYLMQMRVLRACELLRRSREPITAIALAVGFYDHSDFARQFRRVMGLSARAYRQAAAAGADAVVPG
jgi:AraC-like DNA-binding protein